MVGVLTVDLPMLALLRFFGSVVLEHDGRHVELATLRGCQQTGGELRVRGAPRRSHQREAGLVFNRIIVPTDGSDSAWRAVTVGDRLAVECDAELELLHIVVVPAEGGARWVPPPPTARCSPLRCGPRRVTVKPVGHSVATTIADHRASVDGLLVMSSIGSGERGDSGSVTTDVLIERLRPVVVGRHADVDRDELRGELVGPRRRVIAVGAGHEPLHGVGDRGRPTVGRDCCRP